MQRFKELLAKSFRMRQRDPNSLEAERKRLAQEAAKYKHAFESTAADRDRLAAEVEAYRNAFNSTAADRNRIAGIVSQVAEPLDAGSFRLDLSRYSSDTVSSAEAGFIDTLVGKFEGGAYDEVVGSLLANTKVGVAHVNDIDYFKPFANYYLGCLLVAQNRLGEAVKYAEQLEFQAPRDGTGLLPYDLRQGSRLSLYKQENAIERGKPGALIVSLPKSASSFLTTAIASTLQIPIMKVTLGEGERSLVVRKWADQLARGGATTHEHFGAGKENVEILRRSDIANIWLQIRDPRDAAYSIMRMRELALAKDVMTGSAPLGGEPDQFAAMCRRMALWIDAWLGVAKADFPDLKVNVVAYSDVIGDTSGVIRRIFGNRLSGEAEKRLQEFGDRSGSVSAGPNFRKGVGSEWRAQYDSRTIDRVWSEIPESVKSVLRLEF